MGAYAQEPTAQSHGLVDENGGIADVVPHPETIAEAIVTFIPSIDMPLHIPQERVRIIEGVIESVEMGAEPRTIIMHAQSLTTPLFAGIPVKIYLRRERGTEDTYYPIAISSRIEESRQ